MNNVNVHLAAAAVGSPSAAEDALRQCHVLDNLWEVQIDLQQQDLASLVHLTVK